MIIVTIIIWLFIRVLCIWCCVSTARRKGLNENTAFLLGILFGLWAAIGYAMTGSKLNPKCPKCKSETTLRTVLNGVNAGKKFYVCINYPECKGRVKCGIV